MDQQRPSDIGRRSVELTEGDARFIDKMVADGAFATPGDVVTAGLKALRRSDQHIEDWLRDDVVPVYDRMQADPSRGLSADEVRRRLDTRFQERFDAETR